MVLSNRQTRSYKTYIICHNHNVSLYKLGNLVVYTIMSADYYTSTTISSSTVVTRVSQNIFNWDISYNSLNTTWAIPAVSPYTNPLVSSTAPILNINLPGITGAASTGKIQLTIPLGIYKLDIIINSSSPIYTSFYFTYLKTPLLTYVFQIGSGSNSAQVTTGGIVTFLNNLATVNISAILAAVAIPVGSANSCNLYLMKIG